MATLKEKFDNHQKLDWDVSWLETIKLAENNIPNFHEAMRLMSESARAVEWVGERIAILTTLVEKAKNDQKTEWSKAFIQRTRDKTAGGRKIEADSDPDFLAKKCQHDETYGQLEWFKQRKEFLLLVHYMMRDRIKMLQQERPLSSWDTTDEVYTKPPEKKDEPEEQTSDLDDFEL